MSFLTNALRCFFEAVPVDSHHNSIFEVIDDGADHQLSLPANLGASRRKSKDAGEPPAPKVAAKTGDLKKDVAARVAAQQPVADLISIMIDDNSSTRRRLEAGDRLRTLIAEEAAAHPAPSRNPTGAPPAPRLDDAADALKKYTDKVKKDILDTAVPPLALYTLTRCVRGVTTSSATTRTGFLLALAATLSIPAVAATVRPEVLQTYVCSYVMSQSSSSADRRAFRTTAAYALAVTAISIACPPAFDKSGQNAAAADRGVRAIRAAAASVPVGSTVGPGAVAFATGLAAAIARLARVHRAVVPEKVAIELCEEVAGSVCGARGKAPSARVGLQHKKSDRRDRSKSRDGKKGGPEPQAEDPKAAKKGKEEGVPVDTIAHAYVLISGLSVLSVVGGFGAAVTVVDAGPKQMLRANVPAGSAGSASAAPFVSAVSVKGWGEMFAKGVRVLHSGTRAADAVVPFGIRAAFSAAAVIARSEGDLAAVVDVVRRNLDKSTVSPKALAGAVVDCIFTPTAVAVPVGAKWVGWDAGASRLGGVERRLAEQAVGTACGKDFVKAISKAPGTAAVRPSSADIRRTEQADGVGGVAVVGKKDTKAAAAAESDSESDGASSDDEAGGKRGRQGSEAKGKGSGAADARVRAELVTPIADAALLKEARRLVSEFYQAAGVERSSQAGPTGAAHDRSPGAMQLFNSLRRTVTMMREVAVKAVNTSAVATAACLFDFAVTHVLFAAATPTDSGSGGVSVPLKVKDGADWFGPSCEGVAALSLHTLPSVIRRLMADMLIVLTLSSPPTTKGKGPAGAATAASSRRSPNILPLPTLLARVRAVVAAVLPLVKTGKVFCMGSKEMSQPTTQKHSKGKGKGKGGSAAAEDAVGAAVAVGDVAPSAEQSSTVLARVQTVLDDLRENAALAARYAILDEGKEVESAAATIAALPGTLAHDARFALQPHGCVMRACGTLQSTSTALFMAALFGATVGAVEDLGATASDLAATSAQIASCVPPLLVARVVKSLDDKDAKKKSTKVATASELREARVALEAAVSHAVSLLLERLYGNQLLLPSLRGRLETLCAVALRNLMQCDLVSPMDMLQVAHMLRRPMETLRGGAAEGGAGGRMEVEDAEGDGASEEGSDDQSEGDSSGASSSESSSGSDSGSDGDADAGAAGMGGGLEEFGFMGADAPSDIDLEEVPEDTDDDDVSVDRAPVAAKRNVVADDVQAAAIALRNRMIQVIGDYLSEQGSLKPTMLMTDAALGELVSLTVATADAGELIEEGEAGMKKGAEKDGKKGKGKDKKDNAKKGSTAKEVKKGKRKGESAEEGDGDVGVVWKVSAVTTELLNAMLLTVKRLATKTEKKFVPVKGDVLSASRRTALQAYLRSVCATVRAVKVAAAAASATGRAGNDADTVDHHPTDTKKRFVWGAVESDAAIRTAVRMLCDFTDRRLLVDQCVHEEFRTALLHAAVVLLDAAIPAGYRVRVAEGSEASAKEWVSKVFTRLTPRIRDLISSQRCTFGGVEPLAAYASRAPQQFLLVFHQGVIGAVAHMMRPRLLSRKRPAKDKAAEVSDDDSGDDVAVPNIKSRDPANDVPGGVLRSLAGAQVEAKRIMTAAKTMITSHVLERAAQGDGSAAGGKGAAKVCGFDGVAVLQQVESSAFGILTQLPTDYEKLYRAGKEDLVEANLAAGEGAEGGKGKGKKTKGGVEDEKATAKAEAQMADGVERLVGVVAYLASIGGRAAALQTGAVEGGAAAAGKTAKNGAGGKKKSGAKGGDAAAATGVDVVCGAVIIPRDVSKVILALLKFYAARPELLKGTALTYVRLMGRLVDGMVDKTLQSDASRVMRSVIDGAAARKGDREGARAEKAAGGADDDEDEDAAEERAAAKRLKVARKEKKKAARAARASEKAQSGAAKKAAAKGGQAQKGKGKAKEEAPSKGKGKAGKGAVKTDEKKNEKKGAEAKKGQKQAGKGKDAKKDAKQAPKGKAGKERKSTKPKKTPAEKAALRRKREAKKANRAAKKAARKPAKERKPRPSSGKGKAGK